MSDKIGKYYWVKTESGKEIAFKRDSGLWEMHGIDCLEDCKEVILEVYGEVANDANTSDSGLHLKRVSGSLRDKFASNALNGLMLRYNEAGYTDIDAVNEAYKIADMMMERRGQ